MVVHFSQVSFVGTIGGDYRSDMAVDELSIQPGACTTCRFNIGIFGLTFVSFLFLFFFFHVGCLHDVIIGNSKK